MTMANTLVAVLKDELHSIVSALVGGARYGVKIRLPHALVMTALFRGDMSKRQKLRNIVKLVLEHATNLAAFATLYKTILAALKWLSKHLVSSGQGNENLFKYWGRMFLYMIVHDPFPGEQKLFGRSNSGAGYPERSHHALIAGAIGGYFVWGRYSSVNYQIILYLTSRVLVALGKRLLEPGGEHSEYYYKCGAALVWGLVMVLFEETPDVLHKSLKKSMDEIYRYQISTSFSEREED